MTFFKTFTQRDKVIIFLKCVSIVVFSIFPLKYTLILPNMGGSTDPHLTSPLEEQSNSTIPAQEWSDRFLHSTTGKQLRGKVNRAANEDRSGRETAAVITPPPPQNCPFSEDRKKNVNTF